MPNAKRQGSSPNRSERGGGARGTGVPGNVPGEASYLISVAAELAGMHAQTLRTYDRLGLVTPLRTPGGGRRYSERDVERLREIQRLSQEEGVNLAGIKRIIELSNEVEALNKQIRELSEQLSGRSRGELVPVERTSAVVVWQQPRGRRR